MLQPKKTLQLPPITENHSKARFYAYRFEHSELCAWRICHHSGLAGKNVLLNTGGTVLNIFWLIFFGWWLCLMHIATGIAQCISIIGIPVGIANFKIAAIALWPVGRRVVSVETAQAAREANARRRFE